MNHRRKPGGPNPVDDRRVAPSVDSKDNGNLVDREPQGVATTQTARSWTAAEHEPGVFRETGAGVLAQVLREDRLAQWLVAVFAVVALLFLLPVLPSKTRATLSGSYVYPSFVVLAAWSLAVGRRHLARSEERRFWLDLLVAHLLWLLVFVPRPGISSKVVHSLIDDTCYALFYLALILAVERRVHLRLDWRPTAFERLLTWPGVAIYVAGQLLYFGWIPWYASPEAYLSKIPSLYLFLAFDLYLTSTLWYLARSARSRRWRVLYTLLASSMATLLLGDVFERIRYSSYGWEWGTPFDFLWTVPLLLMALAARARHVRFSVKDQAVSRQPESNLSGPAGRTMVMALAFPMVHFLGYGTNLLDPATQDLRERLVLALLVLLGLVALGQQSLLSKRVREILSQREQYEEDLRNSEQDLRIMVERLHTEERLRQTDHKFFEAFRASPDVMAISSLDDGRLIEVNRSFETLIGHRQEEVVGQTVEALGLWADPEERRAMALLLRSEGRVADLEVGFRTRSGSTGMAQFSAAPIVIDGEPCLLSVTHDVTDTRQSEAELAAETERLADYPTALFVLDAEHHVLFANRRAVALCGGSADDLLGRRPEELFTDLEGSPLDSDAPAAEPSTHLLELQTSTGPTPVATRWSLLAPRPEGEGRPFTLLLVAPR